MRWKHVRSIVAPQIEKASRSVNREHRQRIVGLLFARRYRLNRDEVQVVPPTHRFEFGLR